MMLAVMLVRYADELAADMLETYGLLMPDILAGKYPASFIAQLATQLPSNSRIAIKINADNAWQLEDVLIATLCNSFNNFVYSYGGKKGKKPKPIGPSYMRGENKKQVKTETLTINALRDKMEWFSEQAKQGKTISKKGGNNGKH